MPIQGTCRPSARTAVRVPLSTAIMRGTPAIVTGSERELWKPISKPSISDWATSERRARGHVEEAGEEGRRREGDGEPKDDPDALAHRRSALGECEAQAGDADGDDADSLGDRARQGILDRGEWRLPWHGRAAARGPRRARDQESEAGADQCGLRPLKKARGSARKLARRHHHEVLSWQEAPLDSG